MKRPATPRRRPAPRPQRDRRGVLLLVVLSLLVLFLLVGTTFLVTSGQYRTASKVVEKANRTTFQPADLLERALMQLVRDTNSSQSAIRHHSLLRDLYGTDGFVGRIMVDVRQLTEGDTGNNPPGMPAPIGPRFAGVDTTQPLASQIGGGLGTTMGQIVEFFVVDIESTTAGSAAISDDDAVGIELDSTGVPVPHRLAPLDGYYEGSLLTMLSGPCRGSSVRVLDYDYIGQKTINSRLHTIARLRVMAPRRFDGGPLRFGALPSATTQTVLTDFIENGAPRTLPAPATTLTGLGHSFVVNGRPFNGAGVGYNPLALASPQPNVPLPRLSAVETFLNPSGDGSRLGMEVGLTPNSIHFNPSAVASLKPDRHLDPFNPTASISYTVGPVDLPANDLIYLNLKSNLTTARERLLYPGFAGLGDTDESYDAPDYQNMALASQALEPRLRGRVVNSSGQTLDPDAYYPSGAAQAPAYLDLEGVTIPSFHRPDLANFWFHRLWRSQWLRTLISDNNQRARAILEPFDGNGAPQFGLNAQQALQITQIKRKFLLRPLREDHPGFDGSNPISAYATTALRAALTGGQLVNIKGNSDLADDEITFPYWEAVGPWDVDNDGDGVPDSVWVDIGLPVQQTEDGRHYKPLVAMLVEDLDGRLNLNAHGSENEMARRLPDLSSPSQTVNDYSNVNSNALHANLAMEAAYLPGNPAPSLQLAIEELGRPNNPSSWLRTSDQLATGVGWGTAEVSLRSILTPSAPLLAAAGIPAIGDVQYDDYARLLYGRPDPRVASRNVAAPLQVAVTFGRYGSAPAGNVLGDVRLSAPGTTFALNTTATNVPAPTAVANPFVTQREPRTTLDFPAYPSYTGAAAEPLNGFSSPPDLRGRFAAAQSAAGAPVAEPVAEANIDNVTWREKPFNTPDDSPYELDLSSAARKLEPASLDAIRRSYDPDGNNQLDVTATPLNDDAPFSPAELERLLRAFDADAQSLPDRLWNLTDAFDPSKLAAAQTPLRASTPPDAQSVLGAILSGATFPINNPQFVPTSLEAVSAAAQAAINRRVVTTDSWDLPAPNENWTDRLILGADGKPGVPEYPSVGEWVADSASTQFGIADDDQDGLLDEGDEAVAVYTAAETIDYGNGPISYQQLYLAGCDDYVVVMRQNPPSSARLTDYLKYRAALELVRKGVVAYPPSPATPVQLAAYRAEVDRRTSQILFGESLASNDPRRTTERFTFGGLVAPEVLAGRKMDLNRPFGDGRDNNGNGVVDEPQEAGEPFIDDNSNGVYDSGELFLNRDRSYNDANNNGVRDSNEDETYSPPLDYLWADANGDGIEQSAERKTFHHLTTADANGSGVLVGSAAVRDDAGLARQLFARHLYCLALALTDENYLAPYDPDDPQALHYTDPLSGKVFSPNSNATFSPDSGEAFLIAFDLHGIVFGFAAGNPTPGANRDHTQPITTDPALEKTRLLVLNRARQIAQRKLTCRRLAQWAVNVVDFRDPDAIQTEFEYDENPWDGWNVTDRRHSTVLPIDGDTATDENRAHVRDVTRLATTTDPPQPTWDVPQRLFFIDKNNPLNFLPIGRPQTDYQRDQNGRFLPDEMQRIDMTRGLVWGAERPEVLLTEGVAWHDRRLEDLSSFDQIRVNGQDVPADGGEVEGAINVKDDDLDQRLKPKGFAYLEATNPWTAGEQRPAEFYSRVDRNGARTDSLGGVALDRVSDLAADPTNPGKTRSPVWRISCVEEHPLIRNATVASQQALGQASDDPITTGTPLTASVPTYLRTSIAWGPWAYSSDKANLLGGLQTTQLHNAYLQYHLKQSKESLFGLLTLSADATGQRLSDFDGIGVSMGVLEHPPTVPDTSFPAFDPFSQPRGFANGGPLSKTLSISSKVDAKESDQVVRGILEKPTTFVERVFYLTPSDPANKPSFVGTDVPGATLPAADLVDPGLHIPLLSYDVPSLYDDPNRVEQVGRVSGVSATNLQGSNVKALRVRASKFATAFDRTDIDRDGDETEPFGAPGAPVGFAPLLPGRRAVIGTTGSIYWMDRAGYPNLTVDPADLDNPFDGAVAMRMANRYASVVSQSTAPPSSGRGAPNLNGPNAASQLRRFEMIPDPNPNRHQFAIRMNGFFESLAVRTEVNNLAFNLTGGEAAGQQDATLAAATPVIAIPIDHFSISEPVDEYLARQIELDRSLDLISKPNYQRLADPSPIEEHFAGPLLTSRPANTYFYDEPFDLLPEVIENQTTSNYRSLHLERLANPLLPWNPAPIGPTGQAVAQHDPSRPVNPYLPVDARSVDLTAFNSTSDAERFAGASTDSNFVNAVGANGGPEQRHRRARNIDSLIQAIGPRETLLGFASNERGRPAGPFPLLWLAEPARLLWKQSGGSTYSEIAHTYLIQAHNGYVARVGDQLVKPTKTNASVTANQRIGIAGTAYDSEQLDDTPYDGSIKTSYNPTQILDVAWRVTLGVSDWMSGEFHVGSGLGWRLDVAGNGEAVPPSLSTSPEPLPNVTPDVLGLEQVDLDGDGSAGDLAGAPEVNSNASTQTLASNGRTQAANNAALNVNNAKDFLYNYLRTQQAESSTTPELAWPNRPFVSAGELLQVPAWGGSRMLTYFSVFNWQFTQNPHFTRRTQVNPYDGEAAVFHDGLDYVPTSTNASFDGDFTNDGTLEDNDNLPEASSTNEVRFRDMLGHFGHLMNFFQTARFPAFTAAFARNDALGKAEEAAVPRGGSNLYRLLDYVYVPSRFTATDTLLNADVFGPADLAFDDPRLELAAPFNRVDSYREPGRVNLNTIVGRRDALEPTRTPFVQQDGSINGTLPRMPDYWSEVYDGLMHRTQDGSLIDYPSGSLAKQGHLGPAWRDVALSRRGYVQPGFDPRVNPTQTDINLADPQQNQVDYSPMRLHPDFPTVFANPFRAPGEGANVPLVGMVQTGVDATLLRAHPLSPGADGAWGRRGVDDRVIDKGAEPSTDGSNTLVADLNGNRDDAAEAGVLPMQVGGSSVQTPGMLAVDRLSADLVLARYSPTSGMRGRVPDTFLQDAFRPTLDSVDPRSVSPLQSLDPNDPNYQPIRNLEPPSAVNPVEAVSNSEIAKRSTPVPLFSGASLEPSLDTERNATQRYLPIQRLSNLSTTRSNVYAVWITVGFFEVKPAKDDPRIRGRYFVANSDVFLPDNAATGSFPQAEFFRVYPDGWTLGEEINRDTGGDRRHRGFYVVDRSRPVAFKPGEDANVSDTVLLRRRIE